MILDKNGQVYKLRGPNPLMSTQSEWDKSRTTLINFGDWNTEVVREENEENEGNVAPFPVPEPKPPKPQAVVVSAQEFIQEAQEAIPEPKKDDELNRLFETKGSKIYCAPAIGINTHTDPLYGDSYNTTQYGEKYMFDAIVLDQSDLELSFWCLQQLTPNSIVYQKGRGERWWRVQKTNPKTGGYVITALISDLNPDFS